MADIFISYKREDRPFAERLSIALEQLGFDIWWDFELLSGDRYRKVIRAVIEQCPATIVLWSPRAIESDFVMDEASHAQKLGKLCPVRIEKVDLPFGFGQSHTDDLATWEGELSHPGFQALVRALEARIGRKGRLGAPAHTPAAQAETAELESFKAAQIAGNASALRAFLHNHPRGQFAGFVRGQLETMAVDAPIRETAAEENAQPRYVPPPSPPPAAYHPIADIPNPHHTPSPPRPKPEPIIGVKPPMPWPMIAGGAAIVLLALFLMFGPKGASTNWSGDVNQLNPQVREAVLKARATADRGIAAAVKAREEARLAEQSGLTEPKDGRGAESFVGDYAGDRFAGMHHNGVREGLGVIVYGQNVMSQRYNRARYEGEWAHDERNGVGVFYWRNGNSYAGEADNAVQTGKGVFTFSDGSRYEGEFSNDNYNGYGVVWSPAGLPLKAGIWSNGTLTAPLYK